MFTSADADLARRDSSLPGLALLLDSEAFVARLRRAWPEPGLGAATSTYLRYKPGTNCLVAYRLQAAGATFDVYAKAYRPGRSGEARTAPEPATTVRPVVLEGAAVVVFPFPEDDKLGILSRLADASGRDVLLRKLLPDRPDTWQAPPVTLRYKPERRYVAQVTAGEGTRVVLKAYAGGEFETAQANARALHSRGPLRLARRLGRSRRHRILVLEWLPGGLLREAMGRPDFDPGRLAAIGTSLAELHRQPSDRLPGVARERDAAAWHAAAEHVGFLCPRLGPRAASLARRLASHLADGPPADRAIHGDFHASQVLEDESGTAFLDLDQAARGDPEADLGTFLANLERDALQRRLPAGRVERFREGLMEGYGTASGEIRPPLLSLFTSGNLLQLAPDAFRSRQPDWPERIEGSLSRAEALLGGRTAYPPC